MTDELRQRYRIKGSVNGVVVTAAAKAPLQPGDVIVEVATEAVRSAADAKQKMDALKNSGRKSALLLVADADGEPRFVALALH
jgi:serine protease Do